MAKKKKDLNIIGYVDVNGNASDTFQDVEAKPKKNNIIGYVDINGRASDTMPEDQQIRSVQSTVDGLNKVSETIKQNKKIETKKKEEPKEENKIKDLYDRGNYITQSGLSGVTSALTGMVSAPLQYIQEGSERSKEVKTKTKDEQKLDATLKTISNFVPESLRGETLENINTIMNDKKKSKFQKGIDIGLQVLPNILGSSQTINTLKDVGASLETLGKGDVPKNIRKAIETPTNNYSEMVQKQGENYGTITRGAGELSQVIGNMAPSIALSTVDPTLGLTAMGIGVKGQATTEAEKKGATLQEANAIGYAKGATEMATEALTGGLNFFGKGALDDIAEKGINKFIPKNKVLNFVAKKGAGIGGEIFEETISDLVGLAIDKSTTDPDATYTLKDWGKTALLTMLSTGILNSISGGYGRNAYELNAQELNQIAQKKQVQQKVNQEMNKIDTSKMSNEQIENTRKQIETNILNEIQNNVNEIIQNEVNAVSNENPSYVDINNSNINEVLKENEQTPYEEQITEETPLNEIINEDIIEEENLDNEIAEEYDSETVLEESIIDNFSEYLKQNNQELTKEDIEKYIQDALDNSEELSEEEKEGLKNRLNDTILKYLEEQNKPNKPEIENAVEPEIQPQVQGETSPRTGLNQQITDLVKTNLTKQQTIQETAENKADRTIPRQQIIHEDRAIDSLANSVKALNLDNYDKFTQKEGNYVYKQSDNPKIDAFRRQAATYLKNSGQSQNFVRTIEKIISDKGIEVRFNPKLGNNVNGTYKNGVITLNPNSNRAGEFLAIHELTHAIGTKDMIDMIQKYRESNAEFNEAVEKLLKTYKSTEINEEALADIAGQLFGNQEYINNLSMENPSLFKKIYNEIKYLWHQFTGYKSQNQFIEDLKNKWETAYRNSKINQNDNKKFSIEQNDKGYYVKADRQVIKGNDSSKWGNQVENYINNSIRKGQDVNVITENGDILTITRDTAGKAKFRNEVINADGTKRKLTDKEFYSKLTAETHIDELAKISKKINKQPVPDYKNHKFAKDGFDYRIAYFQDLDGQYYRITMSVGKNKDIDTIYNVGKMKNLDKKKETGKFSGSKAEPVSLDNNISQSNKNVKSDISTKYSIQENGNNTQELDNSSFNLDENAKRYEDLTKAKYILYFTKDNGDVRINIMDSNNNLVNQLNLYNQREAISQLGEKLGKQIYQTSNTDEQRFDIGNDINNLGNETDYFMTHRPTETGITADDLTKQGYEVSLPSDIYEHPEYYSVDKTTAKETMNQLNKVRNNPDADITIYRATTGNKINSGDWVTLSKNYAAQHNQSQFDGKGNIIEKVVKAKDIQHAGDVLEEWGYFPTTEKYSKDNSTWREYLEKEFLNQGTRTNLDEVTGRKQQKTTKPTTETKTTQETPKNESKKSYLSAGEQSELESLKEIDERGLADNNDLKKIEELERKQKGITKKFPDLKTNNKYEDIKSIYGKYKDSEISKTNKDLVNTAKEFIEANNQGRRTIDQWKQVAEYIGANSNAKTSPQLQQLAMETWFETKPNNANNLNRQGKKYVPFAVQDWVNAVYKGAGVGTDVKLSLEEATDNKKNKVDLKTNEDGTYTKLNTPKQQKQVMPDVKEQILKLKDKNVSNFYSNITEKSKFIDLENRIDLMNNDNLHYYDAINNKETLQDAMDKLNKNTEDTVGEFFAKDKFTPEDVATGWILVKRYQDAGNFEAMSKVIEKMREQGTQAGQTVQMYGILQRLTPEGMEYYSQKQLDNAYNKFTKNKSKKQIEKYANNFTLTAEEHQFIKDTMKKIQSLEDEDAKKVEVAKIVKMLSDKIPPEKGQRLKAWMRMSMLGNPKTQVRNVAGNAIIQPVNWVGDIFSSAVDKAIAKKTGVRTKGTTSFEALTKGTIKGFKESVRDAKLGIDTRDINLNRFEENIGAKPFYEGHKSKVLNNAAKVLNKTNQILGNVMSGGDRIFYQGIYDNSLQNQMKLNKVDKPTQEMMDIAEQEALSRTWNDSNQYTKSVLQIRNAMNKLNFKGYGLGDVLVPFAKTPANLTKAIVDYSPVGLARTIIQDGKNFKNSLQNGQYSPQLQHKFADSLGKGVAGSILYIAAYALAKAGITTGASDDDKDVANFMRNTLGIQPYSIKIGNKSFTYDWAQPIAAPFAITADAKRLSEKENQELSDIISSAVNSASNILLEQSFLSSIQDVFNNYNGPSEAIQDQIKGLPARATPTFFKQIADMIDPTKRQTFEKGQSITDNTKNQVIAKLPEASKSLQSQRDTLGREIEKFGGNEDKIKYAFNVFLNPANTNKGKTSTAAEEIYSVYEATGDKTIMPRQVGYSENIGGTWKNLTAKERNELQKQSGQMVEENVKELKNNKKYQNMSNEDKAAVINGIVNYSYAKAKSEVFDVPMSNMYKTADKKASEGYAISDYYTDRISKRK